MNAASSVIAKEDLNTQDGSIVNIMDSHKKFNNCNVLSPLVDKRSSVLPMASIIIDERDTNNFSMVSMTLKQRSHRVSSFLGASAIMGLLYNRPLLVVTVHLWWLPNFPPWYIFHLLYTLQNTKVFEIR